jgi:hypothetical protein
MLLRHHDDCCELLVEAILSNHIEIEVVSFESINNYPNEENPKLSKSFNIFV